MSAATLPLLISFLFPAAAARAQAEKTWDINETRHFIIHHENKGVSLGDYARIERIYEALHPTLWSLVPWMATEKTQIYLYKGYDSYLQGRFKPPPWSGGLLRIAADEKALGIYEPMDTAVVAHELTHLYFHSFFAEKEAQPPLWLDEGLASMLQNEALTPPDPRSKGPVLRSVLPLAQFVKTRPEKDAPGAWVDAWYQQAQSVVWFIKRGHVEASFTDFCGKLRDGEDLETALREAYGYSDIRALEEAWLSWRPKKGLGMPNDLNGQ